MTSYSKVLITGGTGSFGKTMLRSLLEQGCEEVRILSRDEEKQDALRIELGDDRVKFYLGDIRNRESVDRAMVGVDSVFHAAALKQVPSCEFFPLEAVRTNIIGSENVIRSAIATRVTSVVCLSTDKAVFPINSMGMSKALMEKLAQAAARELGQNSETTISCVRYGNVMYSRGSVIPLFISQIKNGQPITITEPTMTRFLMPLCDSVDLVKYAFTHARQGDVFIKKAAASTVIDLVEAIKRLFRRKDHPVKAIGWRHGEKLFETLASLQELGQAEETEDYFRIHMDTRDLNYKSFFTEGSKGTSDFADFNSHNARRLSVEEIEELLTTLPEIQAELASV